MPNATIYPIETTDLDAQTKIDLACAYRMGAIHGIDDLTYTHISSRTHSDPNAFLIGKFGLLFEEMRASDLQTITYRTTDGLDENVNRTGFSIHSAIYDARPDVKAIVHVHTPAGTAVSAMKCGLLPISQFAFHMHNKIGYHDYHGLTLREQERDQVVEDLADNPVLIMRNHGLLTVGKTLHEALFFMYHLEQACQVQVQTLSQCTSQNPLDDLVIPSKETLEYTNDQLLTFEEDIGMRDWIAMKRKVDRVDTSYRD